MQNSNPLSGHFRQPSVYMKLPSGGRYWQPGSISMPANGEIGIMAMTTKDEIMLRTPDALMNGQGVVSVIESCVPAISNAWAMPSIDVDAVLIAIRMATYGEDMDIESKCANCETENKHQLNLGQVLMRVRSPNYNDTITVDNLTIKLKPMNYLQNTQNNIARFEEQKIIQLINNDNIDGDTRKAQLDIHLQKIIASNIEQLTNSTESITTESGEIVDNKTFIAEFYDKSSNIVIKTVQKKLREFADIAGLPPTRVKCEGCEQDYDLAVNFDYANFFEPLS